MILCKTARWSWSLATPLAGLISLDHARCLSNQEADNVFCTANCAAELKVSTANLGIRQYSSSAADGVSIADGLYNQSADHTLELLQESLETYLEDSDVDNSDVEFGQGVLTVKLGRHGTYVINKQAPNRQIWLSSPVSGPSRFDFINGTWIYHRTGQELLGLLETEISQLIGIPLSLNGQAQH